MVSVHVISSIDEELRGFDGHDRFVAALADEITRARTFQRPLALLMVRSARREGGPRQPVGEPAAHACCDRSIASASTVRPRCWSSLPEAAPEAVQALAAALAGGEPALTCGAVRFPADGSSVEELIAALQVATRAAPHRRTSPSSRRR